MNRSVAWEGICKGLYVCSSFVWSIWGEREEEDQCLSIHARGGGEPLIPRETGGNGCQPGLNLFATHPMPCCLPGH